MSFISDFSNPNIAIAVASDIPAIKLLMDSAYRGESSKKGWTSEAHLIAGDTRIDEESLQTFIQKTPGSIFLKYTDNKKTIIGCVNLQIKNDRIYLGSFCVSPQLQGAGIGKEIMTAAEEYAKNTKCRSIYMTVISTRKELIDWYIRRGYHDTGARKPFIEDNITGKHLQALEFMFLEKHIT